MTNRHSFIQFLFEFGACAGGIRNAKRFRTPQLFWDGGSTLDSYRRWLLTACRVPGFFPEDYSKDRYCPTNTVLSDSEQVKKKFLEVPWKRGQRGQFVYTHQQGVARVYAKRLHRGLDPLTY